MESVDILIIGGGPAGISTALHLVQAAPHLAAHILILEKANYPRQKLCGGALVNDAEALLENLGLDVNEVPNVSADMLHLAYQGAGLRYTRSNQQALRIIRRDEFDAWLAHQARRRGISILEGAGVTDMCAADQHIVVHTDIGDIQAKVVVGADGSNGVVRRKAFPNASSKKARVLEALTLNTDQAASQRPNAGATFDFLPVPYGIAGYIWDFPTQVKGKSVRSWGIYDANLFSRKDRPSLKELLYSEMKKSNPQMLKSLELKGHPINWFTPFNKFSTNRILLVGDAAGADPLFGEGISMALGYGNIAAASIVRAFKDDQFEFSDYKQRLLFTPLGQALTARWALANIIYRLRWGWFQVFLWRMLKPIPQLVAKVFLLNWGRRMGGSKTDLRANP